MSRKQFGGILIFCVISWTFALACLTAAGRMNEARHECGVVFTEGAQAQTRDCAPNSDSALFYEDMLTQFGIWAGLMPIIIGFALKWKNDRDEVNERESINFLS